MLRPSLALAALAAILVLLGLAITGPASAATKSPKPEATKTAKATPTRSAKPSPTSPGAIVLQRGSEVRFGEDVVVPKGTTVPSVGVFGGDITVNGRVTDSVVAFGGDVTINGTVGTSTVAASAATSSSARMRSWARTCRRQDASLVLFGGELTRAPGAQVIGQIKTFTGVNWGDVLGWVGRGMLFNPVRRPQLLRLGRADGVLPRPGAGGSRRSCPGNSAACSASSGASPGHRSGGAR